MDDERLDDDRRQKVARRVLAALRAVGVSVGESRA